MFSATIILHNREKQSWADAKVFAFVHLRAPDAKPFCQSSACVPEILLRLASMHMGEWVNTVGRTISFLVAKAVNFKIRKNSRLHCVFRIRVESFSFVSFASFFLFEDCCVFPHCVNRMHSLRMCKRCERKRRKCKRRERERQDVNAQL